jgi:hypothetical protein
MELPSKDKHIISTSELKKNLFRLISLFMGFSSILDDKEGFIEDFKSSLLFIDYPFLFEEEFSKLIIEIAINARVLDDSIKKNKNYKDLDSFKNVETLGILDEEPFTSPREAINKIIHADYVGHDIRSDDIKPYYMPSLQLVGKKGKNEWIAEVYLLSFCKVLYDFACENDNKEN